MDTGSKYDRTEQSVLTKADILTHAFTRFLPYYVSSWQRAFLP